MKNRKGFTLIELLGSIIVLAIVALIAVPLIMNFIEFTRIKSAEQSVYGYIAAINHKISSNELYNKKFEDKKYNFDDLNVKYKGMEPTKGQVTFASNQVVEADFCVSGYHIKYSQEKAKYIEKGNFCPEQIEDYSYINEVCKGKKTYESGNYYISKAEDLVCLSKLVNEGNDFSDSNIILLEDIDLKDTSNYKDINDTFYGDINENGSIEGIYVEINNDKGFKPIGTKDTPIKSIIVLTVF